MIPNNFYSPEAFRDAQRKILPSKTFCIDFENKRLSGKIDGTDALKQSIYMILRTERYRWLIYSRDYGAEFDELRNSPKSYIIPQLQRRITEALLTDDRITAVSGFKFEINKNIYSVTFEVTSNIADENITTTYDVEV